MKPAAPLDLEAVYTALEAADGSIPDAAEALGCKLHTLNSFIKKHAPLQAIVTNRNLKIADFAKKAVLDHLGNPTVPTEEKLGTARWALEHLESDQFARKQVNENKNIELKELSFEELEAMRNQVMKDALKDPQIAEELYRHLSAKLGKQSTLLIPSSYKEPEKENA